MAYQLKSTGLAASCTMAIAVDPDTGVLKDFASAAVTGDMVIGNGATYGTTTWGTKSRKYIQGSTSTDIAFGSTKPVVKAGSSDPLCIVAVTEVGSTLNGVIFGGGSSKYFATRSVATGGSTHPTIAMAVTGSGNLNVASGQKRFFGVNVYWNGSNFTGDWFSALHDDEDVTFGSLSSLGFSAIEWHLDYLCRYNSGSSSYHNGKVFGVFTFDRNLTQNEITSLHEDWLGVLLEPSGDDASITLSPDPASVVNGGTTQVTISRSVPAPAGAGVTYNLTSSNTAVATVPATVNMAAGQTTATFDVTGVSVGSSTITATNAADSSETDSITVNVVVARKLKLLAHVNALGATAVKGAVFAAPVGGALLGAPIGEFTGAAFGTSTESGQASLKVAVEDFGGNSLTTSDTPVCVWEGTSSETSALGNAQPIGSNGVHECTVIEE